MRRSVVLALAGLLLLGLAVLLAGRHGQHEPPTQTPPPAVVAAPELPRPALKPPPPSFDVVRVTPEGRAVFAGRAEPRAEVTILDDAAELGRVTADGRGEWVFVPDRRLAPGAHTLALRSLSPTGVAAEGEAPVVLALAAPESPGEVVAVKLKPDGTEVLQAPQAPDGGAIAIEAATLLTDDAVYFAGRGPAEARLQVYYDDHHLGGVLVDRAGRWRMAASLAVTPGLHVVRADQIGAGGEVAARVEVMLDHGGVAAVAPGGSVVVDRNGETWRISRGGQPTTVYRGGREQQRDPREVRPGQVR